MPGPRIVTLGCRLNSLESEIMGSQADKAGSGDTIIVNTCAVTLEAERQARQTIRRLRREHPSGRIIVTGCAAQLNPERFAAMDEVDRVVGNSEKLDAALLAGDEGPAVAVSDIMAAPAALDPPLISGFEERTRALVQVQQGCDHRCTFCIIPFARGANRSLDPGRIVEQVRTLVDNGYLEVVLTGVDVSSYGRDDAGLPALGGLVRLILNKVPGLARLRISSLDPAFVDDEIIGLLAGEERFMPHLHLSLQAADDTILKRMKRRHTRKEAIELAGRVRKARPETVFGADLIAGFPTETDAMFDNTLAAVDEMGLTYLHVFPYSPRPGTAAARMPAVEDAVVKRRARLLRQVGEAALKRFLETCVGDIVKVLVERDRSGHSRRFAPVQLAYDAAAGTIVEARAIAVDGEKGRLIAEIAR